MDMGEVLAIETFDGETIEFQPGTARAMTYGNFGAPPTEFNTRSGYKQDGLREIDYTIQARPFSVQIYHPGPLPDTDRDAYWTLRRQLHNYLRPNRGGPLKVTLVTPGLVARSIYARATPGLILPPVPVGRNDWAIDETVDFIAHDPFWFDPTQVSESISGSQSEDLVFPITFPIIFGFSGVRYALTVNYTGTWLSYPVITLTGPYTQAVLEQVTTGAVIQLTVPLAANEQRIINLDPLNRSLVDSAGVNQWGDLGRADMINWYIAADPEAPGGVNELDIRLYGATLGTSAVTVAYFSRFFAL